MFGRGKQTDTNTAFSVDGPISSILGKDMKITGDLLFSGKARIDGKVVGDVKGDSLVLSESARIKGNVEVEMLICQGKIEGDLKVQNLLVKAGGIINGAITVGDLLVESGGVINGEVSISSIPSTERRVVEEKQQKVASPLPMALESKA